jgi:DNA-binding CsgD family transcriptional regulator
MSEVQVRRRGSQPQYNYLDYVPTPAEARVLKSMVSTEGSAFAISEELGIAEGTVRTHIQNLFTKLNIHSKVQLTVWWLMVGRFK